MHASINLEFTEDDLVKFAEDVGRRLTLNAIHEGVRHLNELKMDPKLVGQIALVAAQAFLKGSQAEPKVEVAFERPAPEEPTASRLQRCVRIEATQHFDEGWYCHVCMSSNGLHRPACRQCGHERCDVVVTPPPPNGESDSNIHSGSA